jgi:hypothetical protein
MDTAQFWQLIEEARGRVNDPKDGYDVAVQASALLAQRSPAEIVAAQQTLWDLMAASYLNPLWAAAYLINGGCSDDGFEYFRGWLISQGQEVFERVIADPDALAELPAVKAVAGDGEELECEMTLSIVWDAHLNATGNQLPDGSFTIRYPELGQDWNFDFDDHAEMTRRLPRLAALYLA